jgi:hypothetical protein
LIGGMQTVGLRFQGRDGFAYEFRSIVKDVRRTLPAWLQNGILKRAVNDQMAAQFPLGGVLASEILEAAGILAPRPIAVVLPNDPRLGDYRPMFAGRVGLFALHANERDDGRPGFGGYSEIIGDDEIEELLARDPDVRFDATCYLRIRLVDMLLGDWDRHEGQWSWAVVNDESGTLYRPIPEDRDWAFARLDGILPAIIRIFMPRYVGFSETYPAVFRLTEASFIQDQRILNQLSLEAFQTEAQSIQDALTDSVFDAILLQMPPPYRDFESARLRTDLRHRRDALGQLAHAMYAHLADDVHVFGTPGIVDHVRFEKVGDSVLLTLQSNGIRRFERILSSSTRHVTLHIDSETDSIDGADDLPFKLSFAEDTD